MYFFVIDASASVSSDDFTLGNRAVALHLEVLHERSKSRPNQPAELAGAAWFGGNQEYVPTAFFNCSYESKIKQLQYVLWNAGHPQCKATGIYSAIAYSTVLLIEEQKKLSTTYPKMLIVITDGTDNSSPADHKSLVRQVYPNNQIILFIIAVGSGADVNEFESIATKIIPISGYGELAAALLIASEAVQ